MIRYNGNGAFKKYRIRLGHRVSTSLLRLCALLFLSVIMGESVANAQESGLIPKKDNTAQYDQISVLVMVEGSGSFYLDVQYDAKANRLFVNTEDLFKALLIPCKVGQRGDSLGGFIENENRKYAIDFKAGKIVVGDKTFDVQNRLLKEMGSVYMESSLLDEAFGIILTFNFRALTVLLKANFELPIIKMQRVEKLRNNLSKVTGELTADTLISRNYHLFNPGILDWSLTSTQPWKGTTSNRVRLAAGAELLYGETDVSVDYFDRQKFDDRQLQYLWRWVDNDKQIIKQAQLGKIYNPTVSFINAPIIGAVIRNSPTTVRKATGYYTINDHTEPNWSVELYINNVFVDYTVADASGSYKFKVPVVYGFNSLKLKFYGPMGEERTEERTLNIPYTVVPVKEFEYGLSGGVVQDSIHSLFGRGEFDYGVSRSLTVGGGLEYLSSIPNGPSIPFARATIQPLSRLTLNGEYAYGVKSAGLLDYYVGKSSLLELGYTRYKKGQLATYIKALEERKVKFSVPLRFKKITGFAQLDFSQFVYTDFSYSQGNLMFSLYYDQFSANSTSQINWIDRKPTYFTTELSFSYRMKEGYVLRASARYNVSQSALTNYKAEIEKRILKGYISASYENNLSYRYNFFNLNFKYDFPFARTNAYLSSSGGKVTTTESAQGSLAFGGGNRYVYASNISSVSKGGIVLYPFLDLNQNGIFDKEEHRVNITTVRINGGKAILNEKDSLIRIPDLNAFTSYMLGFSNTDLENIAWRFPHKTFQVLIDPDQFKRVDIPVIAVGEASGTVYRKQGDQLKGIGRILIKIKKKASSQVIAEFLSEMDGYIYYMGLAPGDYEIFIDPQQLSNLGLSSDPPIQAFRIKPSENGDIVEGLDFVLSTEALKSPDSESPSPLVPAEVPAGIKPIPSPVLPADSSGIQRMNFPEKKADTGPGITTRNTEKGPVLPGNNPVAAEDILYKVQLLATHREVNIKAYFGKLLADIPGLVIEESAGKDGYFRYSTGAFHDKTAADKLVAVILRTGWKECFIVVQKGE